MGFNYLKLINSACGEKIEERLFNIANQSIGKITKRGGISPYRQTFSKSSIEQLPEWLRNLTTGLKKPSVSIGVTSRKGSSITGCQIFDSGKPVFEFAGYLDRSAEKPIFQFKERAYNSLLPEDSQRVFSIDTLLNFGENLGKSQKASIVSSTQTESSLMLSSRFNGTATFDATINPEGAKAFSKRTGIKLPGLQELKSMHTKSKSSKKINEQIESFIQHKEAKIKPNKKSTSQKIITETDLRKELEELEQNVEQEIATVRNRMKNPNSLPELENLLRNREIMDYNGNIIDFKFNPDTGEKMDYEKLVPSLVKSMKIRGKLIELENKKLSQQFSSPTTMSEINSLFERLSIKTPKIEQYKNPKIIEQLRNVNGTRQEQIEQIKNIFLKEAGLNPSLINVENAYLSSETGAVFDQLTGKVFLNHIFCDDLSKTHLTGILAHELDHAEKIISTARVIGYDEYKNLCLRDFIKQNGSTPESLRLFEERFNTDFWRKIIEDKSIKLEGNYFDALDNYTMPKDGDFKTILDSAIRYFENPLEKSAWNKQFEITQALGDLDTKQLFCREFTVALNNELKRIQRLFSTNQRISSSAQECRLNNLITRAQNCLSNMNNIDEINANIQFLRELQNIKFN